MNSFYFGSREGVTIAYPGVQVVDNYKVTERSWYRRALSNPDLIMSSPSYSDAFLTNQHVVTFSKAVQLDDNEHTIIGVAGIDVVYSDIDSIIDNITGGGCSVDGVECYIVDKYGYLFYDSVHGDDTGVDDDDDDRTSVFIGKFKGTLVKSMLDNDIMKIKSKLTPFVNCEEEEKEEEEGGEEGEEGSEKSSSVENAKNTKIVNKNTKNTKIETKKDNKYNENVERGNRKVERDEGDYNEDETYCVGVETYYEVSENIPRGGKTVDIFDTCMQGEYTIVQVSQTNLYMIVFRGHSGYCAEKNTIVPSFKQSENYWCESYTKKSERYSGQCPHAVERECVTTCPGESPDDALLYCGGSGDCINGMCVCDAGFEGGENGSCIMMSGAHGEWRGSPVVALWAAVVAYLVMAVMRMRIEY